MNFTKCMVLHLFKVFDWYDRFMSCSLWYFISQFQRYFIFVPDMENMVVAEHDFHNGNRVFSYGKSTHQLTGVSPSERTARGHSYPTLLSWRTIQLKYAHRLWFLSTFSAFCLMRIDNIHLVVYIWRTHTQTQTLMHTHTHTHTHIYIYIYIYITWAWLI